MRIFGYLYDKSLTWSKHKRAPHYLSAISFAESSFFPIPPDVVLIPMVMAKPKKAWFYAFLTTVFSVLGGLFGYILGFFFFEGIQGILESLGYMENYRKALGWFALWGFWLLLVAGFSPIPYKIFTIAAGFLGMGLLIFILASIIGRAARFFLVSSLAKWGGETFQQEIHRYIEVIGWSTVVLLAIIYFWVR